MSPPFWNSLPAPSPPHPSRLLQRPCLSFLSHTANSHWLSILHMVNFFFRGDGVVKKSPSEEGYVRRSLEGKTPSKLELSSKCLEFSMAPPLIPEPHFSQPFVQWHENLPHGIKRLKQNSNIPKKCVTRDASSYWPSFKNKHDWLGSNFEIPKTGEMLSPNQGWGGEIWRVCWFNTISISREANSVMEQSDH